MRYSRGPRQRLRNFYGVQVWEEGERVAELDEDLTESRVWNFNVDDPKTLLIEGLSNTKVLCPKFTLRVEKG